ncbi:hypothetical protein NML43_00275 [Rhodopseudomonas palustris]|uniref:hypothetical protein n=1 Tax=Rhodopseudomonas palustris TaxID=1076 RepID=UPI0020CEF092|nr:hypothetical protein [Rhodopseudomonas palustris]MCP9625509.1 hypothetical protein [Rhodopseudomonas palustris]
MADLVISTPTRIQRLVIGSATALMLAGASVLTRGWRNAALWVVGIALGYALYGVTFGFSTGLADSRHASPTKEAFS